jgi:hypothetical protein
MYTHKTRTFYMVRCAFFFGTLMAGCTDSTTIVTPAPISVRSSADSLLSDGLGDVVLSAELPAALPQDALVEFSTSLGRFINPAGGPERKVAVRARDGVAEVRLISAGEVGTAQITATGAGSRAQTTVELAPSRPEIIDLFLDRTAAPADGAVPVTVTAVLRRQTGTVSRGIPVRFEARDSATQELIPALGGVVAADSAVTAKLRLTSTIPGTVQVRAFTGTVASEARTIRFTPLPPATPPAH